MKKQLLLTTFILILFMSAYSQNKISDDIGKLQKGSQVIANARKAAGIEKDAINAFHIRLKTLTTTEVKNSSGLSLPDTITEINAVLPDKIQYLWIIEKPFFSKITNIWNGEKYKALSEVDMLGTRTVRDTTNLRNTKEILKNFEGKIGKEKLEKLRKVGETDPKDNVYNRIWTDFFPLTLIHPFEQKLEFTYAGKAESSNRTANIVDTKSANNKSYRLLFDSETNHLLMMIVSYQGFDGDYETKYYYSNRESAGGILIPKKIKAEHKFTPTGAASKISYLNIDVEEFSLKPEFKPNLFDVN